MSVTSLAETVHARRILDVVKRQLSGAELIALNTSELVARSWSRCVNDYQLDPLRLPVPPVMEREQLRLRLDASGEVLECARTEMTTLYQQLADLDCAVVLAGTDGTILHMVSTPEFARDVRPLGFCHGGIWSERTAGTNGMGTCVASGAPVAVRQQEHFYPAYTQLTCSAVPIYGPSGEVCGVLDVTSRSPLLQQHSLVLLGMTAQQIENRLLDRSFRDAYPVRFHSRPEFVYTLHEGRLVVDERGVVQAANRSALMQLGFRSVSDLRSHTLEDIFETTLDNMLQRSTRSSFHPVATYRAHVSNRFFVVAQQPASAPESESGAPIKVLMGGRSAVTAAEAQAPDLSLGDGLVAEQFARACRVIRRGIPVLMHGETGSGKEYIARAVHQASPNAAGVFVAVNCASLPETLIESELFGYRAGAFTGAQKTGRRGLILQAARGTLFLDEIGDMPLALQARLLRVLDERRVTPLGSEESLPVDFQLISASHRDLADQVAAGEFREDLYYRLNGLTLELPPLRDRADRLGLIRQVLQEESGGDCRLTAEAERLLSQYPWPGNMRQLRHVMRTLAALFEQGPIDAGDIPANLLRSQRAGMAATPLADSLAPPQTVSLSTPPVNPLTADTVTLGPFEAHERELMLRTLELHRWNVSHVAKALNISRNTVYRKLHKLRIDFGPLPADADLA